MPERLVLYVGEKNVSSWSMRAWIACTFKGVAFEERALSVVGHRDDSALGRVSPTADVFFAPAVWRLTAFAVPASPRVRDYMAAVLAHPAVRPWLDEAKRLAPVENE